MKPHPSIDYGTTTHTFVGSLDFARLIGQSKTKRQIRRREDNEVRRYVSRLWAEDWDSPEDSAPDEGNPSEAQ